MLTGKPCFKDLMINGMVGGPDGKKMSKSLGNVIEPEDVLKKYPADAIRQWAATVLGEIGADANEATPALIDALSDDDVGVREAAKQSLDLIDAARVDDVENAAEPQSFEPGR